MLNSVPCGPLFQRGQPQLDPRFSPDLESTTLSAASLVDGDISLAIELLCWSYPRTT